jgi:sulfur-carrier protein adenylyltransferase/sulfurtransferase
MPLWLTRQQWLYYHHFREVNMKNLSRYQRQILLPGMGIEGQQLLQDAKVLVIGAGGLGCPALQYLVAAGIGTIGIVDGDTVDITNLHRQILYGNADLDQPKALVAKEKLQQLNPTSIIEAYPFFIDQTNAFELAEPYDLVLDGSDNFGTRYLVNDVCVLLHKPLVYGAVYRFEGQVAVFNCILPDGTYSAQYRDLFPVPPAENTIPNCAEAGVLGVLPGIIGSLQANEVIKLIIKSGKPLINQMLTYNALTNESYKLAFEPCLTGQQAVPSNRTAFEAINYNINCSNKKPVNVVPVDAALFDRMINEKNIQIIDVREIGELPVVTGFKHIQIPLSAWDENAINRDEDLILFCQSGIRSKQAAMRMASSMVNKTIFNLEGGINAWLAYKSSRKK